jgi:hypothetical protein
MSLRPGLAYLMFSSPPFAIFSSSSFYFFSVSCSHRLAGLPFGVGVDRSARNAAYSRCVRLLFFA